jgi:hypothetical protein
MKPVVHAVLLTFFLGLSLTASADDDSSGPGVSLPDANSDPVVNISDTNGSEGFAADQFHHELGHVENAEMPVAREEKRHEKKTHRHETFAAVRRYLEMRDGKLDPYDLAASDSGMKVYKHLTTGEMDTYTQASGDARVFVDDRLKAQFPMNAYGISPEEYRIIRADAVR